MNEPARLLHNMSSPPKTVITYDGLGERGGDPALGQGQRRDVRNRPWGEPIRFAIGEAAGLSSATKILHRLGEQGCRQPWVRLAELIEVRALELPIPDGCLVVPALPGHREIWTDLLTVLAVLAKSSEHVWLRAKTPSFPAALRRRELSLFIPPSLHGCLPREKK